MASSKKIMKSSSRSVNFDGCGIVTIQREFQAIADEFNIPISGLVLNTVDLGDGIEECYIEFERPENDNELASRLKAAETAKANRKKQKENAKAAELKTLARLKAKYETN